MKKAISLINLLEEESLDTVLSTIKRYGFEYVELPLTYVLKKPWEDITVLDVENIRYQIKKHDLKVNSLQSISFGLDYDICKVRTVDHARLEQHFSQVAVYASMLGCSHVVYGSPGTRKGTDWAMYKIFFHALSIIFSKRGISFCLENNSKAFGSNFGYEAKEIYNFIDYSKIDNLYSHFDTGNEYIEGRIMPDSKYVKSIHISNNKQYNFMKDIKYVEFVNECLKHSDGVESITMENMLPHEDYELLINRFTCITK